MRISKLFYAFGFIISIMLATVDARAQGHDLYEGSIGVRAGVKPGVAAKWFVSDVSALEAIAQFPYGGYQFTLLYEAHTQVFSIPRFHWVFGIGGHVGVFDAGKFDDPDGDPYENNVTTVGLDGLIGLEYTFTEVPFSLSVDVKPFVDIVNPGRDFIHSAFTLRYYW